MELLSTRKSRRDRNMRKSSRMSYTTEVMKPEIWEKFPDDLLEAVLARLPISTIIRFRTVCKRWDNLITSQSFSEHCAQVSQANPWFYTTFGDNNYEAMYDPCMKRWYYPNTFEIPILPVSSAGGLVCFRTNYIRALYVCNPLTQSFKRLPDGSIQRWGCSGMAMNGTAGYKVLKLGLDREYEIYDSVTNCWSHLGKIPECIKEQSFIIFNSILIDNTLYFKNKYPEGIVSCDTSTGVWTQHVIQAPLNSSNLQLAESDGRIMLVGLLREENNSTCVCIWEVQKISFILNEVDRKSVLEFIQCLQVGLTCLGNKGLLLCFLKSHNMYCMVTYNIATRKWVKVQLPFEKKVHEQNLECGTAFQPCLTAMP